MLLVSNFRVYITKEGNGAISFIENELVKRIIIPKADQVPKQVFDLYFNQLSSFKHRHYAIARWIVKDIRRMGYEFKQMPLTNGLFLPVKNDLPIRDDYPLNMTKEDKLSFLWSELERISKKMAVL